ncbi:MAG: Arc family DNA-binding protein [Acidobacteriota bacterium]
MAQILVRNLEDALVDRLKRRAHEHHRSLESEVRRILVEAVELDVGEFRRRSQALRDKLAGRSFPDPAELIASDRTR